MPLVDMRYKHTQNWFLVSEIRQKLLKFINGSQTHHILEIGCFEGLSSVFFADNLLTQPESTLVCVDPFLKIANNDHSQFLQNNEEANFDYNITHCQNSQKITVHKITSDEFFKSNTVSTGFVAQSGATAFSLNSRPPGVGLEFNVNGTQMFDFIYIDGCHEPDFIMRDMENSFKILEPNGIMWMDDYCGGDGSIIKKTMDEFLDKYRGQYIIIHRQYQLAITKQSNAPAAATAQ